MSAVENMPTYMLASYLHQVLSQTRGMPGEVVAAAAELKRRTEASAQLESDAVKRIGSNA